MRVQFFNKQKRDTILIIAGLIAGLYFHTFKVINIDFSFFPGDLGDGRLVLYFLEHAHKFFTGKLNSFWDAPFMYPAQNVLAYSENLLGSAPFYSFFRLLGFDTFTSFQCWYIAVSTLNYLSAFYLIKFIFKNNQAAVIGAFIFAFSIALQSQLTHAQTFPRFAIPLAILMAYRFSLEYKFRYFFLSLFFVVYQIYCGIYLGFMLAVPLGIYFILILTKDFFNGKKIFKSKRWFIKAAISGIINLIVLLPLILPYMGRKISPSLDHYKHIAHGIPTLKSYIFSQQGSLLWDFLSKTADHYKSFWNHQVFAGALATICFIWTLYLVISHLIKSKGRIHKATDLFLLFIAGFITFFIYLRYEKISAYIFIYFMPGFSSMRALARIINIELVFFGISAAYIYVKYLNNKTRYSILVFTAIFILLVTDNFFYGSKMNKTEVGLATERTKQLDKIFSSVPSNSVVSFEPDSIHSLSIYYHIDAMLLSQKYDLITINAYTATSPGDYSPYWNGPNEESRNFWLEDKKLDFDTLYVVKGPASLVKISKIEIQPKEFNSNEKNRKLNKQINYIKSDTKWMELIEKKAREKNISIDSMIIMDARWVLKKILK